MTGGPWRHWCMQPPDRLLYRRVEVILFAEGQPEPGERGEVWLLLDLLHGGHDMTFAWWRPPAANTP